MSEAIQRERMETDVLIVGGGPAGLSCAIRLAQLVAQHNVANPQQPLAPEIYLIDKALELGHHQLSGAMLDPRGIEKLFPNWLAEGFPIEARCEESNRDGFFKLRKDRAELKTVFAPGIPHNLGNYVVSLQKVVAWLAKRAEEHGVNIFAGFAGASIVYEDGRVAGVVTRDMGFDRWGEPKAQFEPGVELRAKVTVLAEGTRGSLAKHLIPDLGLDHGRNPQVYQLGCKEVWQLSEAGQRMLKPGDAIHTMGSPLEEVGVFGGGWVYGMAEGKASIGLVCGLDYKDPCFDPHAAFQTWKTLPWMAKLLEGGTLLHYGAKTIPDGGYYSMPKLAHHGVVLIGDSAGFMNSMRLKGVHLAMESGMLAAEAIFRSLLSGDFSADALDSYRALFKASEASDELWKIRNFRQGWARGKFFGMANTAFGMMSGGLSLLGPRLKIEADSHTLRKRSTPGTTPPTDPSRFDDKLTFAKLKDVYFSGTSHEEDQPCHLQITDPNICISRCYHEYGNPCQHFCPANVYEIVPRDEGKGLSPQLNREGEGKHSPHGGVLKINASNCVHCKTCDIKDPYQIINWVVPEGGGGPVYNNC